MSESRPREVVVRRSENSRVPNGLWWPTCPPWPRPPPVDPNRMSSFAYRGFRVGKKTFKAGYDLRKARLLERIYKIPGAKVDKVVKEEIFDTIYAENEYVRRSKKQITYYEHESFSGLHDQISKPGLQDQISKPGLQDQISKPRLHEQIPKPKKVPPSDKSSVSDGVWWPTCPPWPRPPPVDPKRMSSFGYRGFRVGKKTKAGYDLRKARLIERKYLVPGAKVDKVQKEEIFDIVYTNNEYVRRLKKQKDDYEH